MKKALIYLLFLIPLSTFAIDDIESLFKVRTSLINGNIQAFGSKRLSNIIGEPVSGFELGLSINSSRLAENLWPYRHNYPDLSLNFSSLNLGNDSVLGQMFSLYPQLDYEIYKWRKINLSLSGGTGLSYLNKIFDNTTVYKEDGTTIDFDHSNSAIGSHLNILFTFGAKVEFLINSNLKLIAGAKTFHVTNANLYQPNGGLNIFTSNFGVVFTPSTKIVTQRKTCCVPDVDKKPSYELIISGGSRELYYKINQRFSTGSIAFARYKPINNYLRLGFGADLFYDAAFSFHNIDDATSFRRTYLVSDKFSNRFRFGISVQPEIIFDRLLIGFHSGLYLVNPIKNLEPFKEAQLGEFVEDPKGILYLYNINEEDGWLYSRISVKYKITDKFILSTAIKTHMTNAEFVEFGIGYVLH